MEDTVKLINATPLDTRLENYMRICEANGDKATAEVIADCLAELRTCPTEDAELVIHAYWKKEIEGGMYWYACSNCGEEIPKTWYKTDLFSAFCPHCGAQMDAPDPYETEI